MSTTDTERDERLRGIQERAEDTRRNREMYSVDSLSRRNRTEASAADVPWLLAEVARLDAVVTAVREALAGHLRCDQYLADSPISCGWKRAVADVQSALDGGAS